MREEKITADRLTAFSDGVFAVIVTIMVLELKAPDQPAFSALGPLWPTAISYAVSYLFIAIYLDKPPLPHAVRRPSDDGIDMDQLRPSLRGVVSALCKLHGLRARNLPRPRSSFTQGCSCASTLRTTCSSTKYWRAWTPRNFRAYPAYREAPLSRGP